MIERGPAAAAVTLAEAQAYVRIENGEEEAVLAGLIRTATAMCEQFTGRALIASEFTETLAACDQWQRLSLTPVRSIASVEGLAEDGSAIALPPTSYAIDIDADGNGWVRLTAPGVTKTIRVTAVAGMAIDQNGVPEPIRQGILRLAAYLFNSRDGERSEPPAAVTALWRPFRRMRLA